eukprot:1115207-Rhodomonas_salina.2
MQWHAACFRKWRREWLRSRALFLSPTWSELLASYAPAMPFSVPTYAFCVLCSYVYAIISTRRPSIPSTDKHSFRVLSRYVPARPCPSLAALCSGVKAEQGGGGQRPSWFWWYCAPKSYAMSGTDIRPTVVLRHALY